MTCTDMSHAHMSVDDLLRLFDEMDARVFADVVNVSYTDGTNAVMVKNDDGVQFIQNYDPRVFVSDGMGAMEASKHSFTVTLRRQTKSYDVYFVACSHVTVNECKVTCERETSVQYLSSFEHLDKTVEFIKRCAASADESEAWPRKRKFILYLDPNNDCAAVEVDKSIIWKE